ncbi:hypothetical protein GW17_00048108 [Ensete ventricosum]|nr:hypothetical protein GW17_00048108 [Ensete ventricosum]RZR95606.1 hypothetical protein BHM03_00024460 [Ensete ventricosum]
MHSPLSFAPTTTAIYPSGASSLLLDISLFPFSCSEHHCLHEASSLYHNDLSLPSLSQCYSFPIAVVLFLSCEDKPKRYLLLPSSLSAATPHTDSSTSATTFTTMRSYFSTRVAIVIASSASLILPFFFAIVIAISQPSEKVAIQPPLLSLSPYVTTMHNNVATATPPHPLAPPPPRTLLVANTLLVAIPVSTLLLPKTTLPASPSSNAPFAITHSRYDIILVGSTSCYSSDSCSQ